MIYSMPVSSAVKKYLEAYAPSTYKATKSDLIGMFLINCLTRKTCQTLGYLREKDVERFAPHEIEKYGYMEEWKWEAPKRYQDDIIIPKRRVQQFNNWILKIMYAEIFHNMELCRSQEKMFYIQDTIYRFRDRYGIWDHELQDDRVRKAYLRFRKATNTVGEYEPYFPGQMLKS